MSVWEQIERLLLEYEFMAGPGMEYRWDNSRRGGTPSLNPSYSTMMGSPQNFAVGKRGSRFPYSTGGDGTDLDFSAATGDPSGPRPPDRGTPMGRDESGAQVEPGTDPAGVHKRGGAPEPRFHDTWDDNPGGENYQKFAPNLTEAMASPTQIGPNAPFDGPSMRGGRNARPPLDVDGNPVAPTEGEQEIDMKRGPAGQWGGPGTIPGQERGFAVSPTMGDPDPEFMKWKPPEEKKMNLREFFDPETPPTEEVENPEQTHEKDQTDDEIENRLDRVYGQEDNHEFDGGKESSDDSTEMSSSSDDGMEVFGEPGTPDEEVEDAKDRAAPGMFPPPAPESDLMGGAAGVISLDGDPAGIVSLGGDDMEADSAIGIGDPGDMTGPKAQVDAQDFQLTVEPEAGQMPKLSQMLDPQDSLVGKGGPDDIAAMQSAARGLLPQKSTWDDIAIQVGDAIINLRKTPQAQPQMQPQPQPRPGPALQPVPEDGGDAQMAERRTRRRGR